MVACTKFHIGCRLGQELVTLRFYINGFLQDTDNVEILWRLTRVLYNKSKEEKSKEEKKHLVFEAYELIKRALILNDTHFAVHKWYSILLDIRASYDGIKARIKELQNVKNHMIVSNTSF